MHIGSATMYSRDSGGSTHYRGQSDYDHSIDASPDASGQEASSALSYSAQYAGSSSSSASAISDSQHAATHVLMQQSYHEIDPHFQQLREVERYQQRRPNARIYSHPQAEQWPHHEFISHSSAAPSAYLPGTIFSETAPSLTIIREQENLLLQSASAQSLHLQGLSPMEQILYNEQLMLRMQACGVEHGSGSYDSLNQGAGHTIGSSSSEYGGGAAATTAGGRYEEVCAPRPRWSPTQEQIQILESLFNSGTTTPSRDMIVEIAAQLRKYGPIAEANVFYWFQNRKARAKRKQAQAQPRVPPS